jgi:hypothetical protein
VNITQLDLFPTKVLSIQFPDVDTLNRDVYEAFASVEDFQSPDYLAVSDESNLLDLAARYPCFGTLRRMFLDGLKLWLQAAKVTGEFEVAAFTFSNYAQTGQYTIAHNHDAQVAGIYYVKTAATQPSAAAPTLGYAKPWDQDSGALYLLDPRFNASLLSISEPHYFKVTPQPGQMLLFPGYLWHSVTPNLEPYRRLAISTDFNLKPKELKAGVETPPTTIVV